MDTEAIRNTLNLAANEAITRRHEFLTLEHLLLALLEDERAADIILSCGGNPDDLRAGLEVFFVETLPPLPNGIERIPEETAAFERVLHRAVVQAQSSGQEKLDSGNLLAAIYLELLNVVATSADVEPDHEVGVRDLVGKLLETLRPAERLLLTMLHMEGRSVAEIRETTGWNVSLIKVRAFRARQRSRVPERPLQLHGQVRHE